MIVAIDEARTSMVPPYEVCLKELATWRFVLKKLGDSC